MNIVRRPRRQKAASAATGSPGIIRSKFMGVQPARTLEHLYSNLQEIGPEFIGAHRAGNEGARLRLDRTDGHGTYELFKLEQDLYVLTMDCLYDAAREEVVGGEGLLELHLCLQGRLTLSLPGKLQSIVVCGPSLLLLYQPVGLDLRERLDAGTRHVGVSVYCRPSYLAALLKRNGIASCPLFDEIQAQPSTTVWHKILPLGASLHYTVNCLLRTPLQGGFRLLHAEAKAFEILCQALTIAEEVPAKERFIGTALLKRLDTVRHVLATQFTPIPHLRELARRVGMSESTLKRAFKDHFGLTLFDYGLECRMNYALTLLRERSISIGQIAEVTGYQHQTSFTAAFREHYGFLPRDARNSTPSSSLKH